MARESYMAQLRLLIRALRAVAPEDVFALKGGTAINLFFRDLPRLSVDIDLTYLPLAPRAESLAGIKAGLARISERLLRQIPGVRVTTAQRGDDKRLELNLGSVRIKIETSPVMRGTVHQVHWMNPSAVVAAEYGPAATRVVSFEDLFAGKLVAALDRQHPRDLYDVSVLFDHEGLSDALFRTFLVYVACSNRPMHELLNPTRLDVSNVFRTEFQGMAIVEIPLNDLLEVRERLIGEVRSRLNETAMEYLLGLHDGRPDFGLIGLPDAAELPAIKWKLMNLNKLRLTNPNKHALQRRAIEQLGRH